MKAEGRREIQNNPPCQQSSFLFLPSSFRLLPLFASRAVSAIQVDLTHQADSISQQNLSNYDEIKGGFAQYSADET